jgi:dihydrodipicolinate synthase/N-acetylneuraminate lyase
LSGDDSLTLPFMSVGAHGVVSSKTCSSNPTLVRRKLRWRCWA